MYLFLAGSFLIGGFCPTIEIGSKISYIKKCTQMGGGWALGLPFSRCSHVFQRKKIMSSIKDLTGGTGDVNPQILTFDLRQEVADDGITRAFRIPVPRYSTKGGRSIVFEVLWIDTVYVVTPQVFDIDQFILGALSTSTNTALTSPTTFSMESLDATVGDVGNTDVGQLVRTTVRRDFTDGAGHGLILAVDTIYAEVGSNNTAIRAWIVWKIGYRFKEISLAEYIGIVQSQQSGGTSAVIP